MAKHYSVLEYKFLCKKYIIFSECQAIVLPEGSPFAGTYYNIGEECNGYPQYRKEGGKYMHHKPANRWRLTNAKCGSGGFGNGFGGDTPMGRWTIMDGEYQAYCAGI